MLRLKWVFDDYRETRTLNQGSKRFFEHILVFHLVQGRATGTHDLHT